MALEISVSALFKLFKILVGVFLALFCLNIAGLTFGFITGHHSLFGLIDLFDFDSQGGVPFYFASFSLLLAALLLFSIYRSHRQSGQNDYRYWLVLASGFLFLSIDEYVGFHRLLTVPLRSLLHTNGVFYFAWVIPGMIICLILVIYFFKFYLHLPQRYKLFFGISMILVVGGAIGMEIYSGLYAPPDGSANLTYSILYTLEQTMEWGGILIFVYSLVDYIASSQRSKSLQFRVGKTIPESVRSPQHMGFSKSNVQSVSGVEDTDGQLPSHFAILLKKIKLFNHP